MQAKGRKEGYKPEDGGDIKIPVNSCFADDRTVVIVETKKVLFMLEIFL